MLLRAIVQAIRAALSPHYLTPPIRSRAILDQAAVNPVFRALPQRTLVPEIANGFTQPTLTRATVATVTDFEGRVIPVVSGEARMHGCRRVRNLCTGNTNTFSGGGWNVAAGPMTLATGVADPSGGTTAVTATAAGANAYVYNSNGGSTTTGNTIVDSIWIRRRTGTGTINFLDASNNLRDITSKVSSTWARISYSAAAAAAGSAYIGIMLATSGDAVDIAWPMAEDVTGQSNQNPSEYVSVGVLSAPYHGAGVDGVRYFSTTNGNVVASNVVTEGAGVPISTATAKWGYNIGSGTSRFSTPHIAAHDFGAGSFTVEAWVKFNVVNAWQCVIGFSASGGWRCFLDGAQSKLRLFWGNDSQGYVTASGSVSAGVTHHCVWGYNASTGKVFLSVDGVYNEATQTNQPVSGGTTLYVGNDGGSSYAVNGNIYSASVFNVALTQAECQSRYAGGADQNSARITVFNPNDYVSGSTFTSATTGEVWTLNGSVRVFGSTDSTYGIPPMFDASGPFGLMPEPVGTNTNVQSQDLATSWTTISTSVATNQSVAPDGTTTADRLTALAAASGHYIYQGFTSTATATTFSVFAKYTNNPWVALRLYDGTSSFFASFNIQTGALGTKSAAATSTITPMANGSFRLTITATLAASASSNVVIAMNNADSASIVTWTPAGTETADFWGMQLELGASTASSYVPTTTVAYQRNAEVHASTCSSFPQGYVEIVARTASYAASQTLWSLDDGTANNRIYVERDSTNMMRVLIVSGGTTQTTLNLGTVAASTSCTVKLSWMGNLVSALLDSNTVQMDLTATIPTITTQHVGCDYNGASQWTGAVRSINVFPKYRTISGRPETDEWLFNARLQAGLMPDYAAGSIYPTFTRADGANGRAVVEDFEGRTIPVNAAEARFRGTRRVRNLLTNSSDLTTWTKVSTPTVTAGITDALGGSAAFQIDFVGGSNGIYNNASWFASGRAGIWSVWLKGDSAGTVIIGEANGGTFSVTLNITTSWRRYSGTFTTNASAVGLWIRQASLSRVYACFPQVEDTPGQSVQQPAEYIPVGAAPLPLAANYLWLPGTSGNSATAPSTARFDVTDDFDFDFRVAATDWTPAATSTIAIKGNVFTIALLTSGKLRLTLPTLFNADSSVAPTISDGQTGWFRIKRLRSAGTVTFYQTTDGTTWTQLGTVVSGLSTAAALTFASGIRLGLNEAAAEGFAGRIYTFRFYNADRDAGGTLVANFDATRFTSSYAGATMTASTTEVWTLNSTGAATMGSGARITNDQAYAFGQWSNANTVGYNGTGIDGVAALDTLPANVVSSNVVTERIGLPITSSTAKFAQTDGGTGNNFTTPNATANRVFSNGGMEVIFDCAAVDWTPSVNNIFIAKDGGAGNRGYLGYVDTTGNVRWSVFDAANGTTEYQATSSVALSFTDRVRGLLKISHTFNPSAIVFSTSTDNGTTWTQLGSTRTIAYTGVPYPSTAVLQISYSGSNLGINGRVYRTKIYDGVGSANPAVDFNPNDYTNGGSWVSSTTGEWWYVNGTASVFGADAASYANLALYSQDFNNAAWFKSQCTVGNNVAVAPDGTQTADSIIWSVGVASTLQATTPITVTAGQPLTLSCYLKANTKSSGMLILFGDGSNYTTCSFDLSAGTAGSPTTLGSRFTSVTASITSVGSGWYRCVLSAATNTLTSISPWIRADTATGTGDSIYVWQCDLRQASTAVAPIVTTSAAVTVYGIPAQFDSKGCYGYLSEGSRQNSLIKNDNYTNAAWSNTNVTVTNNAAVAPDGTTTAAKLAVTATGSANFNQAVAAVGRTSGNTFSVYIKQGSGATDGNTFYLRDNTAGTNLVGITFNYSTGAITYVVGASGASAVQLANGWWRLSLTGNAAANDNNLVCYLGYAGDAETANEFFYVWGAQLEAGAFASTYIPTTSAAITRAADSLTYTSSGNISGTVGTLCCEVTSAGNDGDRNYITRSGGTGGVPLYDTGITNLTMYDGAGTASKASVTQSATTIKKLASSWGGSTMRVYADGVAGSDAAFDGDMSLSASFGIGGDTAVANTRTFGTIRNVKIRNVVKSALQIADMQA